MPLNMSIVFLPVVAFAFVAHLLLRALFSPLRHIPGPFLARFTDFWYFWNVRNGSFEDVNLDLHKKYGMLPFKIQVFNSKPLG